MNPVYEQIVLDDYTQSGEGGSALTYTHKRENRLAKLYNPGFNADSATSEFLTACIVYDMGIPTPKPYRLITDGTRIGAEYELIPGKRSFSRIISQEPERLEEMSVEFARMTRELHACKADTKRLTSFRQSMKEFYTETDIVPGYFKERALAFIDTVEDKPYCLHGDLQIGNIITDGKRTLWIDVGQFSYGVPEWDLAMTRELCTALKASDMEFLFHLTPETLRAHWDYFFASYIGTSDPATVEKSLQHIMPYCGIRMPHMYYLVRHSRFPDEALQFFAEMIVLP